MTPPIRPEPSAGRPSIKLRNLTVDVIDGSSSADLETKLNAYFQDADARGEAVLVNMLRAADYKILIVYSV